MNPIKTKRAIQAALATPTANGNKNPRPTDRKALESHIQHLFGIM